MNTNKTKIMPDKIQSSISIDGKVMEYVNEYTLLNWYILTLAEMKRYCTQKNMAQKKLKRKQMQQVFDRAHIVKDD